ncbi:hypothetical protein [Phyllobacterium chamaecytisi]|uniref:hypothetical protein n=1 Tax=Phyllobacterium chamaecytisi TaxID=2876082 RepID=UPI001CCB06E2|nr:hypothetical protein [Phyllobacterium sp. KW56]MBZ9605029.1 hypothetical protein [Phyllobacterium sp. KW56]
MQRILSLVGRMVFFIVGFVIASLVGGFGFGLFLGDWTTEAIIKNPKELLGFTVFISKMIGAVAILPAILITIVGARQAHNTSGPYAILGSLTGFVGSLMFFGVSVPLNIFLAMWGAVSAYVFYFVAIYCSERIWSTKSV